MSHTKTMYQGLEKQLREKYRRIEDEISSLREMMSQNQDQEPDVTDRASTEASRDWNMIRYNRNRALLKDIAVALKAIENDSYGLCELCGDDIAERRLLAMPSARYCIECQEMIDANPGEFTPTGLGGNYRAAV